MGNLMRAQRFRLAHSWLGYGCLACFVALTLLVAMSSMDVRFMNEGYLPGREALPLFECYSALQNVDESTSIRESIPYQLNIVGRPKNMSLGTMEQGKKHGNDLELEVTRLEILLDGEEQLLIDKINFIHRVKGNDLLAAVRVQMGLNA